ncbi:MAG: peptidase M3, partial [Muribaculaceae bacterium]|nr:peptidase M3 [Muribaculaceae bacterium]
MNRTLLFTAIGACLASVPATSTAAERVNPITAPYTTVYQIPPFDKIQASDYMPALKAAIANRQAQIDRIANNPEAPTFDNTILAMEEAGDEVSKVALLFNSIEEALSSPEIVEVAEVFNPMLSQSSDEIMMNDKLFARIKTLYDNRKSANYSTPQLRAVEEAYRNFVRNGALLNDADKDRQKAINTKLADLYFKFNRNLLSATNDFAVFVSDPGQLSGLSKGVIAVAAEEAANRGKAGQWAFTLHAPSRLAVLESAENRDLRKQIYQGYMNLAGSGNYNNKPIINEILKARAEKAKLLGYTTFADYMTENVMAKTPQD